MCDSRSEDPGCATPGRRIRSEDPWRILWCDSRSEEPLSEEPLSKGYRYRYGDQHDAALYDLLFGVLGGAILSVGVWVWSARGTGGADLLSLM